MSIVPPTFENIAKAAEALRQGGVVVMPTETVYGLAAAISHEGALRRIFEIKKRPFENPLIVHISELSSLEVLALEIPPQAFVLAEKFWPGPLTLVLKKTSEVSDLVTAGGATVAVRMPAHPVARDLISKAGIPLAAPSANRFMRLSPTEAAHIDPEILSAVAMVLDGGPCLFGIESTVVDCSGGAARILRPGSISAEQIQEYVELAKLEVETEVIKSPGQYLRHYAPKTPLRIVDSLAADQAGVTFETPLNRNQRTLSRDASTYAAQLYAALHSLDELGLSELQVQRPPLEPAWEAVWDRLRKAAHRDVSLDNQFFSRD